MRDLRTGDAREFHFDLAAAGWSDLDVLLRLRSEGEMSMIIVEQHAQMGMEVAEQGIVVERGRVRTGGSKAELPGRWDEIEDMLAATH